MARKEKKKKKYLIIGFVFLIILLLIGSVYYFGFYKPRVGTQSMMGYRLYDVNGDLIDSTLQSVVGGTPGVYFIDITVTLTNGGSQDLTCDLMSLSPTLFDSSLTKSSKNLIIGGKTAWTSSLMNATKLQNATGPVIFRATARCSYGSGVSTITLPDKTGTLSLNILPDGTSEATFEIGLSSGGAGTEYCGDSICQASETSITCPADCAVTTNVNFRTTDLTYVSGTAVGYSNTCGTTLTKYGYSSESGTLTGTCATGSFTWCGSSSSIILSIPGGWLGSSGAKLIQPSGSVTTLCVCDDDGSNYKLRKYLTSDSDASKVDSSYLLIDSAKELTC